MGYYDVQQVCLNGHQITDRFNTAPQFRRDFCANCGAKTIHECPSCRRPIPGDYHADEVVFLGGPSTPVPPHCEHCGQRFPWAKWRVPMPIGRYLARIKPLTWYGGLSTVEKIGFWGSIASIVGLALVFMPTSASSQVEQKPQAATYGSKSPAIGSNQGSVTINYGGDSVARDKAYVLRNSSGGATLVVNKPSLDAAQDPKAHVCMAVAGTPVELTGESAKMGNIDMWRKVRIVSGECANKSGWVAISNVSVE